MLRSIGFATCLALLLVACGGASGGDRGGGDTGGGGVAMSAPSNLLYHLGNHSGAIAVRLNVGVPFVLGPPTVTGTVTGYSVSPALLAGVSLNPSTGTISGTPLTASTETAYTITASNDGGSATTTIYVTVFVPPSALTYPSPVNSTVGVEITSLVPTYSGDANFFEILPALPAGLGIDHTTGVVSGTPSRARIPATYTINASNIGGARTTFDLLLAVDPPPAGTVATGVFRDSTVIGLGFVSGAQSGVTNDSGEFTYETGQGITFSVGQVSIGAMPMAKSLITPVDLVADGTGTSNHVLNVVRFLMMLDQDGDASNGIQISEAVTAAAAGWAPVNFDSADLPATLGPLIQQASTADGRPHTLPDAASAQARLRADFFCTYSGRYVGTYAGTSAPGEHGTFAVDVFPDGSMHARAGGNANLVGFDVVTANALNPLLDATFALSSQSPSIGISGAFSDLTYLSGTYLADAAGTFEAAGGGDTGLTYKFVGTYTSTPNDPTGSPSPGFLVLGMNDAHEVSGSIGGGFLRGTVTGTTFVGTWSVHFPGNIKNARFPVSGTFSNTGSALTLDGHYQFRAGTAPFTLVTFSTRGCRAN